MNQNNCTLLVGEDLVVCKCLGITEVEVIEIMRIKMIGCLAELRMESEAGSGCTACHKKLNQIIRENGSLSERSTL
ncbi:MAG: (2Fe-2S)-binding protein [Planctomycetota bacterium]|nr:MAG: (2Fe-2S)-binding protein [Planctomycetota bacterium]